MKMDHHDGHAAERIKVYGGNCNQADLGCETHSFRQRENARCIVGKPEIMKDNGFAQLEIRTAWISEYSSGTQPKTDQSAIFQPHQDARGPTPLTNTDESPFV